MRWISTFALLVLIGFALFFYRDNPSDPRPGFGEPPADGRASATAVTAVEPATPPSPGRPPTRQAFNCDLDSHPAFNRSDGSFSERRARREQALAALGGTLSESADPGLLAAAAWFASTIGDDPMPASLQSALRIDPGNGVVAWTWMDICERRPRHEVCSDNRDLQHALDIDSENAAVWARVANRRFANGDVEEGFDALERATIAARFQDYSLRQVGMFERALGVAGEAGYSERVFRAQSLAARTSEPYRHIQSRCRDSSRTAAETAICLRFGERLAADGRSIATVGLGLTLQESAHTLAGNPSAATIAADRKQQMTARMLRMDSADVLQVLAFDETVLRQYVERLLDSDIDAMQFAFAETERLKDLPGYSPCEAGNR